MTLIDKINIIKENKESAIKALNAYLDSIYNLTDQYFDNENNLKEGLTHDENLEKFIKETRQDADKFEKVRRKLIDNDFDLSATEIARVGLAYVFISTSWDKQITNLQKAKEEVTNIIEKLMSGVKDLKT
jgi:hypothetical protein